MVGLVLDGRVRGPGARALAEDLASTLVSDGVQTHRIELVPTPASSPRLLHSIRRPDAWLVRDRGAVVSSDTDDAPLQGAQLERATEALAGELSRLVEREALGSLHAIGLEVAARVARRVHEITGSAYCVTPFSSDLDTLDETGETTLREARQIVVFDADLQRRCEQRLAGSLHDGSMRLRGMRRGVDLGLFKPVPRVERARAAAELAREAALRTRLQDLDWERGCIVLCLEPCAAQGGFEQFLFALPEVLRQQPALQVIVVPAGDEPPVVDGLRAALAAARPELLHGILQTNELYQPLLDHLEALHSNGRAQDWYQLASRLEPERRVRYTGALERDVFARLLALADAFVVPGVQARRPTHTLLEAVSCGVLPLASEAAGIEPIASWIASEISGEIASMCVLRADAPPVHELEEKLGRVVRLRPELSDRLRTLAVRKLDGRQCASDLRRLHGEPARVAALRV